MAGTITPEMRHDSTPLQETVGYSVEIADELAQIRTKRAEEAAREAIRQAGGVEVSPREQWRQSIQVRSVYISLARESEAA